MGRRRQNGAEQRVVETKFRGALQFKRTVARSADPGEGRSLRAGLQSRSGQMHAIRAGAPGDLLVVIDQHQRPVRSGEACGRLGKAQAPGAGPAFVAYLDQAQALAQGALQSFKLAFGALALAHCDGHYGR